MSASAQEENIAPVSEVQAGEKQEGRADKSQVVDEKTLESWKKLNTPQEIELAFDQLSLSAKDLELTDPDLAIERFWVFFETAGRGSVPVGLKITSRIAQYYWQVMGEKERALDVLDWGIGYFSAQAGVASLCQQRDQIIKPKAAPIGPLAAPSLKAPMDLKSVNATQLKTTPTIPFRLQTPALQTPVSTNGTTSTPVMPVPQPLPELPVTSTPGNLESHAPLSIPSIGSLTLAMPPSISTPTVAPVTTTIMIAPPVNSIGQLKIPSLNEPATRGGVTDQPNQTFRAIPSSVVPSIGTQATSMHSIASVGISKSSMDSAVASTRNVEVPRLTTRLPSVPTLSIPNIASHHITLTPQVSNVTTPAHLPQLTVASVAAGQGRLAVIAEQLLSGKLTPQTAWDEKVISIEDILGLLSQPQWGLNIWHGWAREVEPKQYMLRQALVQVLKQNTDYLLTQSPVTRFSSQNSKKSILPWMVQVSVGHYWRDQKDDRAIEWYEAALDQAVEQKVLPLDSMDDFSMRLFYLIEPLAIFYRETGRDEKAAETYLRVEQLGKEKIISTDWWIPDAMTEAAHCYQWAGENSKAQKVIERVTQSATGYLAGEAIFERYRHELKNQPSIVEAQLVQAEKEVPTLEARLTAQFLIAFAKYNSQDWTGFLERSEQLLQNYELLRNPSQRKMFAPLVLQINDRQKWARLWQQQTIVAESTDLHMVFHESFDQLIERRVFVNTAIEMPLQVVVEGQTDRVQASIELSPWASDLQEIRHQQMVVVKVTPGAANVRSRIVIRSFQPEVKQSQIKLEVSVDSF